MVIYVTHSPVIPKRGSQATKEKKNPKFQRCAAEALKHPNTDSEKAKKRENKLDVCS